jgi:uncharacterized membrane protein YhaH (DUF805 family)
MRSISTRRDSGGSQWGRLLPSALFPPKQTVSSGWADVNIWNEFVVGINKTLSIRELMFGFDGRIGRLALLKYTAMLSISLFVFFALSSTLLQQFVPILQHFSLSAISVVGAIAIWPAAAIVCKRLHDMSRTGLHSMWICPLLFIPLGWLPARWATADIVVLSMVATWLALAPGMIGPNVHGLKSGMRVERIIDKPLSGT